MLKKVGLALVAVLLLCVSYVAVQAISPDATPPTAVIALNQEVDALTSGGSVPAGAAPGTLDRAELATSVPTETIWQIDREFDLHGTVTDSGAQPISGASVDVYLTPSDKPAGSWQVPPPAPKRVASTTTDAAGRYKILLEKGRYYDLQASAPDDGLTLGTAWKQQCQAGEQVNFVLGRACSISGRVLLDGVGVPGVEVVTGPETPYFIMPRNETARASTDRHGLYHLGGLGPGRYSLIVNSSDVVGPQPLTIDLLKGDQEQDIIVEKGRPVEGRVVDADTGTPIGSAVVGMGDRRLRVPCEPDGRFRMEAVRSSGVRWDKGSLQVVAEAPGYSPHSTQLQSGTSASTVEGLEIRLTPAVTAVGRVVDATGSACPQAAVRAYKKRPEWKGAPRAIRCVGVVSSDGRFVVEGLEPGYVADETTFLHVSAPGFGFAVVPLKIESDDRGQYLCGDITLLPALRLSGRVVDSEGRPCAHVTVSVTQRLSAEAFDLELQSQQLRILEFSLGMLMLETDDLGRFHATGLVAGTAAVLARRPGRGSAPEVEVELGPDLEAPTLELVLPAGETLAGQVVDDEGRGLAGAWISLKGPERIHLVTDAEGAFSARGLTRGSYSLAVQAESLRQRGLHYIEPVVHDVAAGTQDVRIVLSTGQPFRCVVQREGSEPKRAIHMTFTDRQTSRTFHEWTNDLGVIDTVLPMGSNFDVHQVTQLTKAPVLVAERVDPVAGELAVTLK